MEWNFCLRLPLNTQLPRVIALLFHSSSIVHVCNIKQVHLYSLFFFCVFEVLLDAGAILQVRNIANSFICFQRIQAEWKKKQDANGFHYWGKMFCSHFMNVLARYTSRMLASLSISCGKTNTGGKHACDFTHTHTRPDCVWKSKTKWKYANNLN